MLIKKSLLTLLSVIIVLAAYNQTTTVKGKLIDSIAKQPLKDATISILDAKDSTAEVYALSKEDGSFEIKDVANGSYIILFSFQGYKPIYKNLILTKDKNIVDFGSIWMIVAPKVLDEVIVTSTPPITVKKDTLEFNAASFKTKPNAVVEDLLKKLPGVVVDKDGNVNAQGENVQRIFVDGKRFFGNDPKLATKNLPPDMVDKIQIYDAQSDQSAFSGFDDGERTKTINIITRKDKRKGLFGRGIASAGDQERYDGSISLNYFNGDRKLTFLSQANNVNKQGFTAQDGGGSGRSRAGITTTKAVGLNYSDIWNKKTEFSGSYFYNNLATDRDARSFTEFFNSRDSTSNFSNRVINNNRLSENHRFNFNIEHKFDSMNSLIIRPDISIQKGNNINETESYTTVGTVFGKNDIRQNEISQKTNSSSNSFNGSINAIFRHRFKAKGHSFSVAVTAGKGDNSSDGTNFTTSKFYIPRDSINIANQVYNTSGKNNSFNTNFSYTFPIVQNHLIELSYNYNERFSNSDRNTFSFDSLTNEYSFLVDSLTNYFENKNTSNRATIGYRIQGEKFNFGIANGVQFSTLKSENTSKGTFFNRNFTNFYPTANFVYNFARRKNLRINYNGRTNQPSVTELQPVPDNSNQTNIVTGNPNLGQEFIHSLRIIYTSVNQQTGKNVSLFVSGNLTNNKIVSSTTQLANGNQTTTFENRNGVFGINGNFNYGFQLKHPKSNLNFVTTASFNKDVSLINDAINYTYNTRFGERINWTMNLNEQLDLNFAASYNYTISRYSIRKQNNRNAYTRSLSIEPTYTFKGGWILSTDFDYSYNGGLTSGYNVSLPLWSASFAKQLFKDKSGELKFSIFDILNQNISVSRTVTNNFVRDEQNTILQRYFLISFTYNLRKFGAGPQNQDRNRPFDRENFRQRNGGFGGGNGGGGFRRN